MNDFHFILQCITTKQYSLSTRVLYRPSSSSYCAPRQYCRMLFVYSVLFIHLRTSLFLLALYRVVVALSMVVTMVGGMVFLLFVSVCLTFICILSCRGPFCSMRSIFRFGSHFGSLFNQSNKRPRYNEKNWSQSFFINYFHRRR